MPKTLNLRACIGSHTSYQILSMKFLVELTKLGWQIALFPIGNLDATTQEEASIIRQSLENAKLFPVDAPTLNIFHQFALAEGIGRGNRIGFPIFELDTFNPQELHHLKSCDKLIVCSEWARGIIKKNGIEVKTSVVPLGVDGDVFNPSRYQKGQNCVFFHIAKKEVRKNSIEIIQEFNRVFAPDCNVELWLLWENIFFTPEENKEWDEIATKSKLAHKIRIIPRAQTPTEIAKIVQSGTCGVYPSRAEGWSLGVLEAMACGKQVIATNYSAPTEFCNDENAILLKDLGMETAVDGKWFHGQGQWCKINTAELGEKMQNIYFRWKSGEDLFNKAGIETAKKFSWKNAAKKLAEIMSE